MEKNSGGQAFPRFDRQWDIEERVYFYETFSGMTLRQWYKGMIVCSKTCNISDYAGWAKDTGKLADALIAEDEEFEAKQ